MGSENMIRTVVFVGAGASCFAELPTVLSFFKRVEWPGNRGLSATCEDLARRVSILEGTQENAAWPEFDAEKLFGWLELLEKIETLPSPGWGTQTSSLSAPAPVSPVISHLRSEIVRIYGGSIAPDFLARAPHRSLIDLVDRLSPTNAPSYFFTTNYDALIEQIFEGEAGVSLSSGRKLRVCTGFTENRPGRWRPELLCAPPAPSERLVHLVKLHGSATWKRDGSGYPIETGWGMPTPHDCLLYFGYKSVPEQEPFIALHDLLKTELLQSDAAIVIGFRFGDPYIRELFDFALRANTKLRVICCLTRPPDVKSPLSAMMDRFSGRILLLADSDGNAIPFGSVRFEEVLEKTLRSGPQSFRAASYGS